MVHAATDCHFGVVFKGGASGDDARAGRNSLSDISEIVVAVDLKYSEPEQGGVLFQAGRDDSIPRLQKAQRMDAHSNCLGVKLYDFNSLAYSIIQGGGQQDRGIGPNACHTLLPFPLLQFIRCSKEFFSRRQSLGNPF